MGNNTSRHRLSIWWTPFFRLLSTVPLTVAMAWGAVVLARQWPSMSAFTRVADIATLTIGPVILVRLFLSLRDVSACEEGLRIWGLGRTYTIPWSMVKGVRRILPNSQIVTIILRPGVPCRRWIRFSPVTEKEYRIDGLDPFNYLRAMVAAERTHAGETDKR